MILDLVILKGKSVAPLLNRFYHVCNIQSGFELLLFAEKTWLQ